MFDTAHYDQIKYDTVLITIFNKSISDSGQGIEDKAIGNSFLLSDAGLGGELLLFTMAKYIIDSVSGTEILTILNSLEVSDAGVGTENLLINLFKAILDFINYFGIIEAIEKVIY